MPSEIKSMVKADINIFRLFRGNGRVCITYPEGRMLFADAAILLYNFSFLVPHNEWYTAIQLATALRKYSDHPRVMRLVEMLEALDSE